MNRKHGLLALTLGIVLNTAACNEKSEQANTKPNKSEQVEKESSSKDGERNPNVVSQTKKALEGDWYVRRSETDADIKVMNVAFPTDKTLSFTTKEGTKEAEVYEEKENELEAVITKGIYQEEKGTHILFKLDAKRIAFELYVLAENGNEEIMYEGFKEKPTPSQTTTQSTATTTQPATQPTETTSEEPVTGGGVKGSAAVPGQVSAKVVGAWHITKHYEKPSEGSAVFYINTEDEWTIEWTEPDTAKIPVTYKVVKTEGNQAFLEVTSSDNPEFIGWEWKVVVIDDNQLEMYVNDETGNWKLVYTMQKS